MIGDFIVKVGVVAAVVIATQHYGVWDSPDKTKKLYETSSECADPYFQRARKHLGFDPPPPPPENKWAFFGIYYYNQAVLTFFSFLNMCPSYLHCALQQVPDLVRDISRRAREQYKDHKETQEKKKKEEERKKCFDERPLVVPVEPDSDCRCRDCPKDGPCPKVPIIPPETVPERKCTKPKCCCPKCDRREAEGWSDNKSKCPRRDDACAKCEESKTGKKKCADGCCKKCFKRKKE